MKFYFLPFWSDDFEGTITGIIDGKQGVGNPTFIKKNF